jgi:hypothetical protein
MANKRTLELIETYIDQLAKQRTFNTRSEYLAWRSGVLAGLIATIADQDSLIRSALISIVRRSIK